MPKVKSRISKQFPSTSNNDVHRSLCGLEERTARFAEDIIRFVKRLPVNAITEPIIRQLVKAGTSIGARHGMASNTFTKRKYRKVVSHCMEASRSTKYWLRMIATALPLIKQEARHLWKEADEFDQACGTILRDQKKT